MQIKEIISNKADYTDILIIGDENEKIKITTLFKILKPYNIFLKICGTWLFQNNQIIYTN